MDESVKMPLHCPFSDSNEQSGFDLEIFFANLWKVWISALPCQSVPDVAVVEICAKTNSFVA